MNRKDKLPKRPLFTRFLEKQDLDKVNGGQTLKFPSDTDERGDDL
jgi:hypothetical protein